MRLVVQRKRIILSDIAEWKNLLSAFHKAARSKRKRADVVAFCIALDSNLNTLGEDIRGGRLPYGRFRTFSVHDPKQRIIHAACFEDRVFHHALMNLCGGPLELAMTPISFACRPGKGVHKAVALVQQNLQRFNWYVKIDIEGYFAAIDQATLMQLLMRRFKGEEIKAQLQRIMASYHSAPGKGLPIGSLTSQHFANYYLDGLDRLLGHMDMVQARVRYMDDILWWCASKLQARKSLLEVIDWLADERGLQVKKTLQIQASKRGVLYCGYRISPHAIGLSRRKKKRYLKRRKHWENCYWHGQIAEFDLQRAGDAVQAITAGTDSLAWRKENLLRYPSLIV